MQELQELQELQNETVAFHHMRSAFGVHRSAQAKRPASLS